MPKGSAQTGAAEQRVEAERILQALETAPFTRRSPAQRGRTAADSGSPAALQAARNGVDHRLIADCITALDVASKEFAQRRMNAGLSRAVAGKTVGSVEQKVHYDETICPKPSLSLVRTCPSSPFERSWPRRKPKSIDGCAGDQHPQSGQADFRPSRLRLRRRLCLLDLSRLRSRMVFRRCRRKRPRRGHPRQSVRCPRKLAAGLPGPSWAATTSKSRFPAKAAVHFRRTSRRARLGSWRSSRDAVLIKQGHGGNARLSDSRA